MKKYFMIFGIVFFSFLAMTACSSSNNEAPAAEEGSGEEAAAGQAGKFVIAVPVDMEDAMKEITEAFPGGSGEITVIADKSGAHQKSIEDGSDIDIFISGDTKQMDTLVMKEKIDPETVSNLAMQELVLIQDKTSTPIKSVTEIPTVEGKIAVGDINTVTVGRYTQEALANLGLLDSIQDKITYLNAAETVIANVEQGNSDVGFVYRTSMKDAANSTIIEAIDSNAYSPIYIPAGIIADQDQGEKAAEFLEFLKTDEVKEILTNNGFKMIEEEPEA